MRGFGNDRFFFQSLSSSSSSPSSSNQNFPLLTSVSSSPQFLPLSSSSSDSATGSGFLLPLRIHCGLLPSGFFSFDYRSRCLRVPPGFLRGYLLLRFSGRFRFSRFFFSFSSRRCFRFRFFGSLYRLLFGRFLPFLFKIFVVISIERMLFWLMNIFSGAKVRQLCCNRKITEKGAEN